MDVAQLQWQYRSIRPKFMPQLEDIAAPMTMMKFNLVKERKGAILSFYFFADFHLSEVLTLTVTSSFVLKDDFTQRVKGKARLVLLFLEKIVKKKKNSNACKNVEKYFSFLRPVFHYRLEGWQFSLYNERLKFALFLHFI